jgi:hypothetical protein
MPEFIALSRDADWRPNQDEHHDKKRSHFKGSQHHSTSIHGYILSRKRKKRK